MVFTTLPHIVIALLATASSSIHRVEQNLKQFNELVDPEGMKLNTRKKTGKIKSNLVDLTPDLTLQNINITQLNITSLDGFVLTMEKHLHKKVSYTRQS